jgi:hypothetical protein
MLTAVTDGASIRTLKAFVDAIEKDWASRMYPSVSVGVVFRRKFFEGLVSPSRRVTVIHSAVADAGL